MKIQQSILLNTILILQIFNHQNIYSQSNVKAIFDEGIYWTGSEKKINRVLNRVGKANFNTYIPCIWHGQGAIWPSKKVDLWYKNTLLAKQDPLKLFIELAHKKGIKVMPCFTVMARQHDFYKKFTTSSRKKMFDVHNTEFRKFIKDVIIEVVKNYDIDGINLDYVRAGQVCYDSHCQKSYQKDTGHNLLKDIATHKLNKSAFNRIVNWQRNAMYSLIKDISLEIKKHKPHLLITISAAPWAESVLIEGQDSITWANDDLIDLIFSMNYQNNIPWIKLTEEKNKLLDKSKLAIMIANYYDRNNEKNKLKHKIISKPPNDLIKQLDKAITFNKKKSYAVYIYSMLNNTQINALEKLKQIHNQN